MIGGNRALQTSMLNDTGSNTFVLFAHEAQSLGYNPNLHATRPVRIHTSNGYVDRTAILLELRVLRYDGQALTGWFVEDSAIVPFTGTEVRLSGDRVRRELFFATSPVESNFVIAARTKTELCALLRGRR
jgi:hypothetical protein